jgi:hypothetical protein
MNIGKAYILFCVLSLMKKKIPGWEILTSTRAHALEMTREIQGSELKDRIEAS